MGSRTASHSNPMDSSDSNSESSFSSRFSSSSGGDVTGPLQSNPKSLQPHPISAILSSHGTRETSPSGLGSGKTPSDLPYQDSWELIKCTVRHSKVSHITHRYFIPPEYKMIIPGHNDRMHKPPRNCFSFHLSTLDAGLHFPLHSDIEDVLIHLSLCLTQFAPNVVRQILWFIVLMRHFKVEPSATHFWALFSITTSTKTNDRWFFYLTSRPFCFACCWVIREQNEKLIVVAKSSGLVLPPSPSVHSSEPTLGAPSLIPSGKVKSSTSGHGVGSDTNEPAPLPLEHVPRTYNRSMWCLRPQGQGQGCL
ncbi:hypothetical protein DH2020_010963 [Rehmannia glutinosa]|uniref:Transposase (putative) gypsy type domain-containing protein n=1 Tax=Rehmannia glutinosa TaxID=99300 RepID=A0ABR0XC19_REHGL